jgi:hypothetical protein
MALLGSQWGEAVKLAWHLLFALLIPESWWMFVVRFSVISVEIYSLVLVGDFGEFVFCWIHDTARFPKVDLL